MASSRPAMQQVLCRYYQNGACRKGTACPFSHSRSDRPDNVCRYYLSGSCAYGNRCRFDHVGKRREPESEASAPSHPKPPRNRTLRVDAPEFVPSSASASSLQDFNPESEEAGGSRTYATAVSAEAGVPSQPPHDLLCPYFMTGNCWYGDNCSFQHGLLCDRCNQPVLHPTDEDHNIRHIRECVAEHEKAMEEAFAVARSQDKQCGICMELVLEKKDVVARRFGILHNCKHVFCLSCIRKWRVQNQTGAIGKEVVRACPECRVPSDFVTPSSVWVEDDEEKEKMIGKYKSALQAKPCKYFRQGKAECPFGNRCFYRHSKPDGTVVEGDSPREVRRRMAAAAGRRGGRRDPQHPEMFVLWEYLERRGLGLGDDSDDDDDDMDGIPLEVLYDVSWDDWSSDSDSNPDSSFDNDWLLNLQQELDLLTSSSPAERRITLTGTGRRGRRRDGTETGHNASAR